VCNPSWNDVTCVPSGSTNFTHHIHNANGSMPVKTSAELYFLRDVLRIKNGIDDGIGTPNLDLMIFLIISWTIVFLIMIKG
jgi:solute carrier family 6 amino acid transporter-like protein 5/7/9/14